MLPLRWSAGLVGLALLACEASTPRALPGPDAAAPTADHALAPAAAAEAGPEAEPDAPPPEPPWSEAAGLAYREVLIGATGPEQALPMVVAIHGLGDDPDNFRHLLDGFTEPCRVILPRGLDRVEQGGWSWFPIRAASPDVEALAQGIGLAADRIAAGLEQLRSTRPTQGKPIVTGFSQGGMLTFALAVHHPEVVGHAIAVGGWLPPPLVPAEGPPDRKNQPSIDALHGTADRAVAYEPTRSAVETLVERGYAVKLHSYEGVGHMIDPQMRLQLFDDLSDAIEHERRRRGSP